MMLSQKVSNTAFVFIPVTGKSRQWLGWYS